METSASFEVRSAPLLYPTAGVLEEGKHREVEQGTPQGGSASPLLANIYLHYAFDLWVRAWRRKQARGEMIVVRFADDIVLGFQVKSDAERFRAELAERLAKFALELHPEKTRLLEFGPYAAERRRRAGLGKPETFNFLGFTHICATKRSNGRFTVLRQTMRKRLQAKLNAVKAELRRGAYEQPGAASVSVSGGPPLASRAVSAQPERSRSLGPNAAIAHPLAASCGRMSSLSSTPLWRHHLRQEPDAGKPHVRICGGGRGQP